jgi:hypothetical protein
MEGEMKAVYQKILEHLPQLLLGRPGGNVGKMSNLNCVELSQSGALS